MLYEINLFAFRQHRDKHTTVQWEIDTKDQHWRGRSGYGKGDYIRLVRVAHVPELQREFFTTPDVATPTGKGIRFHDRCVIDLPTNIEAVRLAQSAAKAWIQLLTGGEA